jgi:hypothetical protein
MDRWFIGSSSAPGFSLGACLGYYKGQRKSKIRTEPLWSKKVKRQRRNVPIPDVLKEIDLFLLFLQNFGFSAPNRHASPQP